MSAALLIVVLTTDTDTTADIGLISSFNTLFPAQLRLLALLIVLTRTKLQILEILTRLLLFMLVPALVNGKFQQDC